MENNYTYIDLDGVILDSEDRMLERKALAGFQNHNDKNQFLKYFEYTNLHPEEWEYIIRDAKSVNNSVEIIHELQKMKENVAILTKIHTLYEMKVKLQDLRNHRQIYIPIIFVPPGIKKHEMVIPNHQLLIDDSEKNVNNWILHGGKGLIFDKLIEKDEINKVKSLEFLLKR